MRFTPKSEAELEAKLEADKAKFAPWPAGTICDYEIQHVKDTKKDGSPAIDKNGNEFLIAEIRIFNGAGEQKDLVHNLGVWNVWDLKRICEANNMLDRYESGQVDYYDLQGLTGKCMIKIESDSSGKYPDKNTIKEFLKPAAPMGKPATTKQTEDELSDSLPF